MTKPNKLLQPANLDFLLACFDTRDIDKGKLYWKDRPTHHFKSSKLQANWNRSHAGKTPGRWDHGHRQIGITHKELGTVLVLEHRLIWLLKHGEAPPPLIDHRNRIPFDNRPSNLREATPTQNSSNSINSSGSNSSGTVSQTQAGTYLVHFVPSEADPWSLEFDTKFAATTALNYLSWLYDTREVI